MGCVIGFAYDLKMPAAKAERSYIMMPCTIKLQLIIKVI